MSQEKWTHEMRLEMFGRLTDRFGPLSSWNGTRPQNPAEEYEAFKQEIADDFSHRFGVQISGGAVNNQINWAMNQSRTVDQSGYRNKIVNTAAAIYAGFLSSRDLPENAHFGPRHEEPFPSTG